MTEEDKNTMNNVMDNALQTPASATALANQEAAPEAVIKTLQIGAHTVTLETGILAKMASGSVMVKCEDTVLLVTATANKQPRTGIDFFPLLVDYEEKMYAVGRLPGGFIKREGRPSEKAILTCRLIDRPIRPLWPDGYRNDVQIVATPLSVCEQQTDVLAILGASTALTLAGLPFLGPVGAVRVGRINNEFVVNPTFEESNTSDLDLVVAGTADSIMMVEAGASFVSEADMLDAIALAHEEIKRQVQAQLELAQQCGVEKKPFVPTFDDGPLFDFAKSNFEAGVDQAYHNFDKDARKEALEGLKAQYLEQLDALEETHPLKVLIASTELDIRSDVFKRLEKKVMRRMVIEENVRADGRGPADIRPIWSKVSLLPRTHGSAVFTRGNTQVLSLCTLGSPGDAQELDGIDPTKEKRWIHHYNFPGFSVGEVKPMRGAGRREIGHGALAERAITPSLPSKEDFPYTIRVNSEVLESNGSTSMASTCGASLALMDAGVPVSTPIGGIAMGLIMEDSQYKVLSDIQGVEDFLGDMDFKVTGNQTGITALQMDIKITGISLDIMRQALEQARVGRLHILGRMSESLSGPRTEMSPFAPRMITLMIDPSDIGMVIGPGGKNIRGIIEETGVAIDIEDSGLVMITSTSGDGAERAKAIIEQMTMKLLPGMIAPGKVARVMPTGIIVELGPNKDGMVHISEMASYRVNRVEDLFSLGDPVVIKVKDIDDRGRASLSIKQVTFEEWAEHLPDVPHPSQLDPPPAPPPGERGGFGDRGDRGGYGDRGGRGGGGGRGGYGGGRDRR